MSKKIEIRCTNINKYGFVCNALLGCVSIDTVGVVTIWCTKCKKNEVVLFTEKY